MIKGHNELQEAYRDDDVAREYVAQRFETPLGGLLHRRQVGVVRRVIREQNIQQAAELAPGPARVTVDVLPLLPRVTLMDASMQMLKQARRRLAERGLDGRARLVQTDAFVLPVAAQFDFLYSFRLIRHFERDDRLKIYEQVARVLKPGGWFVFDAVNEAVSRPLRERDTSGGHRHFDALLTRQELEQELQDAGFELVSCTGAQRRYSVLLKWQIYVAPRSAWLARLAMEVIDRTGGQPLEWVVVCRRR